MIFAALGTSIPFPRLLKRLDELAEEIDEEIIVQAGTTKLPVKYCKVFDYAPSLHDYYSEARLAIVHAGLGVQLELIRMKKQFLAIPRLAKYHEHGDDHQTETCEMISQKYGTRYIINLQDLTPELLSSYHYTPIYSDKNLQDFHRNISQILWSKFST